MKKLFINKSVTHKGTAYHKGTTVSVTNDVAKNLKKFSTEEKAPVIKTKKEAPQETIVDKD